MAIGAQTQQLAAQGPLDRNFTLFQADDAAIWGIFVVVFMGLLFIDNAIIFSKPRKMTFSTAVLYSVFWASCAMAFCLYVGWHQGPHSAYMWLSGYTLQWMMSFDNLFVFHLIFKVYRVPDQLKHRPLFLGIIGQAVFTFSLLTFGEYIFHKLFFLHMIFGAFFIYVGVAAAMGEDEDDDPTKIPLIQWLQANLPFVSIYDTEGHFFVRLPLDEEGNISIPKSAEVASDTLPEEHESAQPPKIENGASDDETCSTDSSSNHSTWGHIKVIDLSKIQVKEGQETTLRATMLFLVVCTMEISDVIFSVDTIVAVSVQVSDLFLAFTCVAFALLTLRATFFIVEVLVQMFSLMKYAISAILVYIGIKLMIDRFYLVPHVVDCAVLVGTFSLSILASYIYDRMEDGAESGGAEQLLPEASPTTA